MDDPRQNELVLDFLARCTWPELPSPVRRQAKRCLLDLLGALIGGSRAPVARIMADFCRHQLPGDQATIAVFGQRVSATGAALANGHIQNALDIDDGYRLVKGHPGACVLPALLAALELKGGAPGGEFLAALVAGYEVGIRAGLIRHAVYPTYHSSGSWGALAAAAASGRLLGLGRDALREALGTAEYHAPLAPMMKCIAVPAMGKDSIGWGGFVGLASVLMARGGFTGIEPIFAECPEPAWLAELGRTYRMLDLYYKPYAACRWAQPAVAGALKLYRENRLAPADIARIEVRTFAAAVSLRTAPPRNTEEAQYHLPFPVAAALLDGEVGPDQVLPPRIFAPDLLDLMAKVEVTAAPEFEPPFPAKALAEVAIATTDGRRLASGVMEAKWEPPDTLPSDEELARKFRWLAGPVLGEARAARLGDLVMALDQAADARALLGLLTPGD